MARSSRQGATAATPTAPKKERFGQLKQIYGLAKQDDPQLPLKLAGIVLGITLVGVLIGWPLGHPVYAGFLALLAGIALAFWFLTRRAERAAFGVLDGQPGASGAVLQGLRRGWSYSEQPVAVEGGRGGGMHDAALVFRAVGRPGVVLVGEGPTARAQKLLLTEKRKVERLTPNVPVTVFRVGSGESSAKLGDEVLPPRDIIRRIGKLTNTLTPSEVTEVDHRLRALGAQRPPIPAGIDPNRARSMGKRQIR